MSSLFARKSIEALTCGTDAMHSEADALPRTLGLLSLTAFGVACTIGAGIFVLTGTVAAEHAGPAVVLSFILASVACALAGLCYAEFASLVPVAGSAYTYAYATLGEIVAWIIGWCLLLEYLFGSALVAIGWAGYATSVAADLGITVPAALTQGPVDVSGTTLVATGAYFNAPAVGVTLLCTILLLAGTRISARVNNVIIAVNVAALVTIAIAGLAFAHLDHWSPFIPPNRGQFGEFGVSGVFTGAGIVFFAYLGFDAVSTMAQETRDARRIVPLALFASLGICTLLYVAIALMTTGLMDYRALSVPDPVLLALASGGPALSWAKHLVGVAVSIGLPAALLTSLMAQIRIFYAMARDGLLPKAFAAIHPRTKVPHIGTIVTGFTAALIAGLFPLKLLGELISIGTLLAFAIVCLGVIVLRRQRPDLPRTFRVPAYPWVPLAGILVCAGLMACLPQGTWIRLLIWLTVGLLLYFSYGLRHSVEQHRRSQELCHSSIAAVADDA